MHVGISDSGPNPSGRMVDFGCSAGGERVDENKNIGYHFGWDIYSPTTWSGALNPFIFITNFVFLDDAQRRPSRSSPPGPNNCTV